ILVVQHVGVSFVIFFFQAEDGIRDGHVTGVQTCALPILARKHCTILRTGIPVASALLVAMPAAYAQQAPATAGAGATAGGLEEVVVTAQKRVENLQDVPISVQVLDTAKLDQLNIATIDDYVKFAPGIAYVRGEGQGGNGEPGESHIYIRGIASGGTNHSGSQPSV